MVDVEDVAVNSLADSLILRVEVAVIKPNQTALPKPRIEVWHGKKNRVSKALSLKTLFQSPHPHPNHSIPSLIHNMASPPTLLPQETSTRHKQRPNRPAALDFGFDLPLLAPDASAGNTANQAARTNSKRDFGFDSPSTESKRDFGFDSPRPTKPQQINTAPPRGSEDFRVDVSLPPEVPLPEAQADGDIEIDDPLPTEAQEPLPVRSPPKSGGSRSYMNWL